MSRYKTISILYAYFRILHQMTLKANQHDRIWFWALESLRLCFGPLNRCSCVLGPKIDLLVFWALKLLCLCFGPLNRFAPAIFGHIAC